MRTVRAVEVEATKLEQENFFLIIIWVGEPNNDIQRPPKGGGKYQLMSSMARKAVVEYRRKSNDA